MKQIIMRVRETGAEVPLFVENDEEAREALDFFGADLVEERPSDKADFAFQWLLASSGVPEWWKR